MRLFFLLLFLSLNSYSQRISINDASNIKAVTIDSLNHQYLLYYQDHLEKINLETFERETIKLYTDDNLFYPMVPMIIDSTNYFVSNAGGMVSVLNMDTITRIDRSFNHLMQHGSIIFSYQSKIYKYGGYGFWSNRNFFTYFDDKTKEWEVVDPIHSESFPEGTHNGCHILAGDDIYIFSGQKINPYRRKERILNDEVWKFNLNDHQWEFLGTGTPIESDFSIKYNNKVLLLGISHITEVDVINNKLTLYEHGLFSPRVLANFPPYFSKGKVYCFVNERGKLYFHTLDEKSFFGKKISERIYYKNYSWWITLALIYVLIPALILIIAWKGLKYYKKRNKIVLLDNGLRYKNKFTEFDMESMKIIKLLSSEKEVSSNRILHIVEKDQYSPAHNERIKIQKLNDINIKIKTLLGITEDVIYSVKSKTDRRIKIFVISKKIFAVK